MSSDRRTLALITEMEALRAELRAAAFVLGSAYGGMKPAGKPLANKLQKQASGFAAEALRLISENEEAE